ncbi:prostatic acid phosphatase-like [Homalodisca vitripennis]|uniref:prostatic acid phosphatase-like n=1 Tax=Homalodisca vitripennis TaxID=197043 RepID=UPI001EEB4C1E|nr:prostatic acid phosphatase-like [Homalodisca vitripennis]
MVPVFRLFVLMVSLLVLVAVLVYVTTTALVSADRSSVSNPIGPRATPTLQFLVVLSRHGNRGPLFTYPSCPYPSYDANAWPYGYEQLTKKGRIQLYQLGAKIRSLYNGFLNEIYYQEDFRASSTIKDRTLMSAAEFLAGLFPPKGFQVWDKDLLWQPLPIFPNYLDHTTVVPPPSSNSVCPRFHEAQNQSLEQFVKDYGFKMMDILEGIQPYTGLGKVTTQSVLMQMIIVWESLASMDFEELAMPTWSRQVYPEPLTTVMGQLYAAYTIDSPVTTRLLQGQLFQEVVSLMEAKINGSLTPDRRMYYYSGHDYTLLGVQGILGLNSSDARVIKPGSALVLELHQNNQTGIFYFQALYIDGGSEDLEPSYFNITGCNFPCDFNLLKNITEKYYNITDYTAECHYNNTSLF